jgi:hypothetical protein
LKWVSHIFIKTLKPKLQNVPQLYSEFFLNTNNLSNNKKTFQLQINLYKTQTQTQP